MTSSATEPRSPAGLPVVVIGAGPVGLAAAAHLRFRGVVPLVLEAGPVVGAAIRQWGHVRTFTAWQYIVDSTAARLLVPAGWIRPAGDLPPTGADIVEQYLEPLAGVLGPDVVRTGARVVAVSRHGLDKSRTLGRQRRPFLVRVRAGECEDDLLAAAVIDASGTWGQRNPVGGSGLPAIGEADASAAGFMVGPLPDVLGADRARFAGRRTLVVGMGHSAANTLLNLDQLAREEPGTEVLWAIRSADASRLYGGGDADQLPDRGRLGVDLRSLVASGAIEHVIGFSITRLQIASDRQTVAVFGQTGDGERRIEGLHKVAAATGFRPDLAMLSEVRLDLDPGLDAPSQLAPLIDPAFHSCGTVPPHGHRELAHRGEPGFFVVGMKSYGRAPTFLIATGNEQVRSIAAHLGEDDGAADEVQFVLPKIGECPVDVPLDDGTASASGGCLTTETAAEPTEHTTGGCDTAPRATTSVAAPVDAAHGARAEGAPLFKLATQRGGGGSGEPADAPATRSIGDPCCG